MREPFIHHHDNAVMVADHSWKSDRLAAPTHLEDGSVCGTKIWPLVTLLYTCTLQVAPVSGGKISDEQIKLRLIHPRTYGSVMQLLQWKVKSWTGIIPCSVQSIACS